MSPVSADSEIVAVTWLKRDGLAVGTTLPEKLPAGGFVQVQVIGGSPNIYLNIRMPTVQLDVYVAPVSSAKVPWSEAARLAERVIAVWNTNQYSSLIVNSTYKPVWVMEAHVSGEPRRINGDPKGYARFSLDADIHWVTTDTEEEQA